MVRQADNYVPAVNLFTFNIQQPLKSISAVRGSIVQIFELNIKKIQFLKTVVSVSVVMDKFKCSGITSSVT